MTLPPTTPLPCDGEAAPEPIPIAEEEAAPEPVGLNSWHCGNGWLGYAATLVIVRKLASAGNPVDTDLIDTLHSVIKRAGVGPARTVYDDLDPVPF